MPALIKPDIKPTYHNGGPRLFLVVSCFIMRSLTIVFTCGTRIVSGFVLTYILTLCFMVSTEYDNVMFCFTIVSLYLPMTVSKRIFLVYMMVSFRRMVRSTSFRGTIPHENNNCSNINNSMNLCILYSTFSSFFSVSLILVFHSLSCLGTLLFLTCHFASPRLCTTSLSYYYKTELFP